MSMWELPSGISGVVETAKGAGMVTVNTVIDSQKGATVIAAAKSVISETPGIPKSVKDLINTDGYGDVLVGLISQTLVETFSDNQIARDLAKQANVYGSTIASSKVSMIQNLISTAILGVAEKTKKLVDMGLKNG